MLARSLAARFELVTPAFASGARPEDSAELRVEAIVGQLRRWWWAQAPLDTCNGGFNVNKAKAFADTLFGAAGTDDPGSSANGQGAFLITLRESSVAPVAKGVELEYLFGPLWGKRKQWLWTTSAARPVFEVSFLMRPKRPDGHHDKALTDGLFQALALWGLLGGLGAGQRRGFGSVQLIKLCDSDDPTGSSSPGTKDEFVTRLKDHLPRFGLGSGPHSFGSFGVGAPSAAIWMTEPLQSANGLDALQTVQKHLSSLRDELDAAGTLTRVGTPPRKQYPINLMSDQSNPQQRKPSPFHFHVARIGSSLAIVLSVLPRVGNYPQNRAAWIIGQAATPKSLVERLGMQRVVPRDSRAPP
jgi:hypothetical protein